MAKAEAFSLVAKHQLRIHLTYDFLIPGLEIRYSYPLSAFHSAPERVIRIPKDQLLRDIVKHLDHLVTGLTVRILPPCTHGHDRVYRPIEAVIALQDDRDGPDLPIAWLNYEQGAEEPGARVRGEVRMTMQDLRPDELSSWDRLRQRIKGIVWVHFQGAVPGS